MITMHLISAIYSYVAWHYSKAYLDLWNNWVNFLKFLFKFFSLKLLFRTLFSPFERITESYGKGLDPGAFFEGMIANSVMRVLGFFLRSVTILIGLLIISLFFLLGIVAFILWTVLPLLMFISLGIGLATVFK